MAYASRSFRTKKAFREAVERGVRVTVFQPGGLFDLNPYPDSKGNLHVSVEGPNYQMHTWYAETTVRKDDGEFVVVKVK